MKDNNNMLMYVGVGVVVVVIIAALILVFSNHPSSQLTTTISSAGSTISVPSSGTYPQTTVSAGTAANTVYYTANFSYGTPIGPGGEYVATTNNGNYTIYLTNTIQLAVGSFNLTLVDNYGLFSGSGKGKGSVQLITRGYCQAAATVPYTFNTTGIIYPNQTNMTIILENANPENYTMPISCTNVTTGKQYTEVGNYSYLSVYPNIISLFPSGGTVNAILTSGRINYTITVNKVG